MFLLDSFTGDLYLILFGKAETKDEWLQFVHFYTACKGVIVAFFYLLFILIPVRVGISPMQKVDKQLAALCFMISIFSSMKVAYDIEWAQWKFWAVFILFYAILLSVKLGRNGDK